MIKKIFYFAYILVLLTFFLSPASHSMVHSFDQLPDRPLSITLRLLSNDEKKSASTVSKKWYSTLFNHKFIYYTLDFKDPICNYLKIIEADKAHREGHFGDGVTIAVIDCGLFSCDSDIREAITQTT